MMVDIHSSDDDVSLCTSPVFFSILGSVSEHVKVRTSNQHQAYHFYLHPILLNYIEENILKKNQTCCKDNPYKSKMEFICEGNYTLNSKEELQYLDSVRLRMRNLSHSLFPYMSKEFNTTREHKTCLLCDRTYNILDFECPHCCIDMLVFLEIMHDSTNWMAMGWQQYMSHRIPATPYLTDVRMNVSTVNRQDDNVPFDIRNHLVLSLTHCSNQQHVASLEILCIQNISWLMKPPCPNIDRYTFIENLKKNTIFTGYVCKHFQQHLWHFREQFLLHLSPKFSWLIQISLQCSNVWLQHHVWHDTMKTWIYLWRKATHFPEECKHNRNMLKPPFSHLTTTWSKQKNKVHLGNFSQFIN